jgi:DNA-binding NarL/FixJ family response regulator
MSAPPPLGVVLVDGRHVTRAGLRLFVDSQPDMKVVLEAGSGDDAVKSIGSLRRKKNVVALVGLGLRGEHDAFWLIRTIREQFPVLPILASFSNADEHLISRALFMGADGFVDTNANPEEFLDAVRRGSRGEIVLVGMPHDWLGAIVEGLQNQSTGISLLTDRERQVLTTAAQGLTARQIGTRLGVRERTVTTHLSRIYKKLGAGGRVAALAAASRSGLVSVGWK